MIRRHICFTLLFVLLVGVSSSRSRAQGTGDDVWSEGGLRVLSKSLQLELAGEQRARVRLMATNSEIIVEAPTFVVLGANPSGMVVKALGPGTVAASGGRRMDADSIEVWLSGDGWGYLKAVRRAVRR